MKKLIPIDSIEFVSVEFALFFLIFLPVYWVFGKSRAMQNILLLVAGIGWLAVINPMFAGVLVVYSFFVAGFAASIRARQNKNPDNPKAGKTWLVIGIVFGIFNLMFFKYYDFFRNMMPNEIQDHLISNLLMPLGISYYTFQSITHLVAVYRRQVSLAWYEVLLYLSFFPTVTSGPIWRTNSMKSVAGEHFGAVIQLRLSKREIIRPALAVSLILLGVIKIWWLAGILDEGYVKPVFSDVSGYGAFSVLLAVYGYTVQLFLNFSGHADMAIGIAMLLGFSLPPNFAAPFLAHNLRDFWNRWHISLSTWIRDYIYIPLGGNRGGFLRTQFNLIVAMVLSGIWHGAGWCFFIWGLVHGFGLAVLNVGDKILGGRNIFARTFLGRIFGIFVTFHFVAFAFVIFRSESFSEVVSVFNAFSVSNMYVPSLSDLIAFGIMLLCFLLYPLFIAVFNGFVSTLEKMPVEFWCVPLAAVVFFLLIVAPSGVPGFIYANF